MLGDDNIAVDKKRVRQSFNQAVATYDEHAALQRLVVDQLIDSLDIIQIAPKTILDIGAGTGYCARALDRRYPKARTILLDISHAMLAYASSKNKRWRTRQRYLCADAEVLPLANASIDFIFSSLTFQWCNELDQVFAECRRVLKPEGLLLFSSLGPDTLRELRVAWSDVDGSPHINQFIDMHDVGDALIRAGFSSPVLECDVMTVNYDDVFGVMRDLRGIGAVNNLDGRRRGLSTMNKFKRMAKGYEKHRREGKLPATYEVVYGHAWCPKPSARPQDGSTVATFPFADIQRRK